MKWDIDSYLEKAFQDVSRNQAKWAEKEIKKLIPTWYQWLLKKTNSRILAKLTGITVSHGELPRTHDYPRHRVIICQWGKVKAEQVFGYQITKEE